MKKSLSCVAEQTITPYVDNLKRFGLRRANCLRGTSPSIKRCSETFLIY
jgi:hypothetical protein